MLEENEEGFNPEHDLPAEFKNREAVLEKLGINIQFDSMSLEARAKVLAMQYLCPPKDSRNKPTVKLPFLDLSGNNQVYKSHANTQLALNLLGIKARYELFGVRHEISGVDGCGEMDDAAIRAIQHALEIVNYRVSEKALAAHLSRLAEKHSYHLMRDKFDSLEWDGVPRLDTWMTRFLLAPDDELTHFWSAAQPIMGVHRIKRATLDHPVSWKYAPILEGGQDGGKSSALRILGFDKHFTDTLEIGADSRTTLEQTNGGVLVVEFAEMALNRMAKTEHNKGFMARATDKARLAYGRATKEVPRSWIGYGSTNEGRYMTDATGNVRYVPIPCGVDRNNPVDFDGFRNEVDQIWAEAVVREEVLNSQKDFGVFLPSIKLRDEAAASAQDRLITSHLQDKIAEVFEMDANAPYAFVANDDVQKALGLEDFEWRNRAVTSEVKRGMQAIGWQPAKARYDNKQHRGYEFAGRERPDRIEREHRITFGAGKMVSMKYLIEGTAKEIDDE